MNQHPAYTQQGYLHGFPGPGFNFGNPAPQCYQPCAGPQPGQSLEYQLGVLTTQLQHLNTREQIDGNVRSYLLQQLALSQGSSVAEAAGETKKIQKLESEIEKLKVALRSERHSNRRYKERLRQIQLFRNRGIPLVWANISPHHSSNCSTSSGRPARQGTDKNSAVWDAANASTDQQTEYFPLNPSRKDSGTTVVEESSVQANMPSTNMPSTNLPSTNPHSTNLPLSNEENPHAVRNITSHNVGAKYSRSSLIRHGALVPRIELTQAEGQDNEISHPNPLETRDLRSKILNLPAAACMHTANVDRSRAHEHADNGMLEPKTANVRSINSPALYDPRTNTGSHSTKASSDLFKSTGELEAAAWEHAQSAGYSESQYPDFFKYGLAFSPRSFDREVYRTIIIDGIPLGTALSTVMEKVRGGLLISCELLDTSSITESLTVMVVFFREAAARGYSTLVRKYPLFISGKQVRVYLVPYPTWPVPDPLKTAITKYRHTRCMRVNNLRPGTSKIQLRLMMNLNPYLRRDRIESITASGHNSFTIVFQDVNMAGRAYGKIISYRPFAGCRAEFLPDPCDIPAPGNGGSLRLRSVFVEKEAKIDEEDDLIEQLSIASDDLIDIEECVDLSSNESQKPKSPPPGLELKVIPTPPSGSVQEPHLSLPVTAFQDTTPMPKADYDTFKTATTVRDDLAITPSQATIKLPSLAAVDQNKPVPHPPTAQDGEPTPIFTNWHAAPTPAVPTIEPSTFDTHTQPNPTTQPPSSPIPAPLPNSPQSPQNDSSPPNADRTRRTPSPLLKPDTPPLTPPTPPKSPREEGELELDLYLPNSNDNDDEGDEDEYDGRTPLASRPRGRYGGYMDRDSVGAGCETGNAEVGDLCDFY